MFQYGTAFGHQGTLFAIGGIASLHPPKDEMRILATSTWEEIVSWSPGTNGVWDAAFTPNDRYLALAVGPKGNFRRHDSKEAPGQAQLWDWRTTRLVRSFSARRFCVWTAAIGPDGRRLASAGGLYLPVHHLPTPHGEIRVWDIESGNLIFDLPGVPDNVFTLAFSPDGARLAAAIGKRDRGRGSVKIWEMQRGLEVLTLDGFPGPVSGVAISPNGERIAAIGSGMLRIFTGGPPGSSSGSESSIP